MRSEAAYFPDALASTPEVGGSGLRAPEIQTEFIDGTQLEADQVEPHVRIVTPLSEASDECLLEQLGNGVKEALAILFRRHARAVRNVAFRILRNEAEADDLLQEVFLQVFRKAGLFDAVPGAARAWIFHVAYNRAFDRRRYLNSRHFYSVQDLDDVAFRLSVPGEPLPCLEQSMETILGKDLTAQFNARLTREQRETIQLFFFEGYALREIGDRTGQTLVNVRNHYYRGLEKLRKFLPPEKLRSK